MSAAGCATSGYEERTCAICGGTEYHNLPAIGHSYGGWSVTSQATCTSAGSRQRVCSRCNDVETQTIALLNHTLGVVEHDNDLIFDDPNFTASIPVEGPCTICGTTFKEIHNIRYDIKNGVYICDKCGILEY